MRKMASIAVRAIACALWWSGYALVGPMAQAQQFPLIIDSPSKLRQVGLSFDVGEPPLKNQCYEYGEGGHLLSTSDEFYEHFKQRGFSVQAMCLGLVSNTHYDPETGRRLPTYIVVYRDLYAENMRQYREIRDSGVVSDELPLDLPDCFKNANPYTDCQFRFGRITGKQLTAAQSDAYKRLGAAIDKLMEVKTKGVPATEQFWSEGDDFRKGFRQTSGHAAIDVSEAFPEDLRRFSSTSFWVRSTSLPRGYGYALDADGGAGPDINPAALKAAAAGLSKSQIDVEHLRNILNSSNK
jgi:hypothetical protein